MVPHEPIEKDDSPFQETEGNPDPEDAPWPDDPGLLQDAEYNAEEWDEGDGGGDTIDQIGQKTLAVSGDRFKNANPGAETCTERHSRWKQVVLRLQPPLSTMMARARVDAFSGSELSVVLPSVYHDIITEPQRRELERQAAQIAGQAVRVNLDFSELGNDADTLAAQEARVMIARQQETVAKAAADPMFQNICRIFGVDSDAVRFTFHNDRTNS